MRTLLTFGITLILIVSIQAQNCSNFLETTYDSITQVQDIYYGSAVKYNGDSIDLHLDIYYPEFDTSAARPLLIAVHGGGFYSGNKKEFGMVKLCKEFAQRGYVTASISYRLGFLNEHDPVLGNFDQIYSHDQAELIRAIYRSVQDTRGAIRFMKGQADNYRIDTSNVFVGGQSAGGFVALHTAYMKRPDEKPAAAFEQSNAKHFGLFGNTILNLPRPDLGSIEGDLNWNGTSSNIKGVINIYGGIYNLGLIECGEPDLYQHHILDDLIVYCGGAKAFHQTPSLKFPFTGNTKNPVVYGACSIRNYIRDSLDCCDLKNANNILPSNLLFGPMAHNYLSDNSANLFFEDAPLFVDSAICKISLAINDQSFATSNCEGEFSEIEVNAVGCDLQYQWFSDNQLIINANSNFYEASESGNYYLQITDCNGCVINSQDISVEIIALPEAPIIQVNQDSLIVINGNNSLTYQWFFNGVPISNAIEAFYVPTESGEYSVLLTNDFGCQSESTPFSFVVTATENFGMNQAIRIFPNPATSTLNIEHTYPIEFVRILNVQGKIIQLIEWDLQQINIEHLESGIYFLEIQSNNLSQILKFVK